MNHSTSTDELLAAERAAMDLVSANVRAALKAANLEGLRPTARAVKMSHTTLDRKLDAFADFSIRELARIAKVTGVELDDLCKPRDAA